jgi:hypothetical protein
VLEDGDSWHVTRSGRGTPYEEAVVKATWNGVTNRVELVFTDTIAQPLDYTWKVLFTGDHWNMVITSQQGRSRRAPQPLGAAKGKSDADLYASGTWLAGRGSAPMYSLDVKLSRVREVGASLWDAGALFTAAVNSDAKLPADSTTFDLDALSVGLAARYWGLAPKRLVFDLQPRYDFTKDLGVGDLVLASRATWYRDLGENLVFYPFVGVEVGAPVRKPDTLYKQAVDLSGWHSSNRVMFGASSAIYIFALKPSSANPYALSLNVSYIARKPFSDEPFVSPQRVDGKRTSVIELRQNLRQEVEAALSWNITTFAGIQAQYKYGSLPPVFKLADHQLSVGLTFKAKFAGGHPSLF